LGLEVLNDGNILAVAPEGTRSWNGRLLRAQPGITLIALHSGAPILPLAHWGGENFSDNLKKFKRTDFHIRVGQLFYLDTRGEKMNRETRQTIADEIMYQIAVLMPLEYQGAYEHFVPPIKHLRFL
jgi:1-acyl-sn-glycerol-3-phosphate acyltransferase